MLLPVTLPLHSGYITVFTGKVLLNTAQISRIDSFTIKLTCDSFSKIPNHSNNIVKTLANFNLNDIDSQLTTGYIPPQIFTFLDNKNLIQNVNNIPLLYHWKRNKADKRISIKKNDFVNRNQLFKYLSTISKVDFYDFHRLNLKKYWWLSADNPTIQLLENRKTRLMIKKDNLT